MLPVFLKTLLQITIAIISEVFEWDEKNCAVLYCKFINNSILFYKGLYT